MRQGFCKILHGSLAMRDYDLFCEIRACFYEKDKNKDLLDKIKVRRNRNENEKIEIEQLAEKLNVSAMTIRRD